MVRPLLLAALLLAVTSATALRAGTLLQAPAGPLVAGDEIELTLVFTNETNDAVEQTPPAVLPLVLRAGNNAVSAVFRRGTGNFETAPLAPGAFRRAPYRGVVPADLTGLVVIDASVHGAGLIALEVRPPHPGDIVAAPGVHPTSSGLKDEPATPAAPPPRVRDFGITANEPVYFSFGANGGLNSRFQLSFKFRPLGPSDDQVAGNHFGEDVYFAFTQTSLWDLSQESKPFTDSSYRPSMFYFRHDIGGFLGGRLGLTTGLEHESNGRAGTDTRSINIAFLRPNLRWGDARGWQWSFSPKAYAYLEKSENPDIARFRGYVDWQLSLRHPNSWKLVATARLGTSGRGSVLFDASFPFDRVNDIVPLGWVHGYLHLQLFEGWGESFLHYRDRSDTQLRIGFMAIR